MMTNRTTIAFAAAGLAAFMSLSAAQAAPDYRYSGQSARAGSAFDADRRDETWYYETGPAGYYEPDARGGWIGSEDSQFDRAARPDRQR